MKVRDVIKMIENDGWYVVRQRGSHKQYKHPAKKGLVTIACHRMSDDLAPGTLSSILKTSRFKNEVNYEKIFSCV